MRYEKKLSLRAVAGNTCWGYSRSYVMSHPPLAYGLSCKWGSPVILSWLYPCRPSLQRGQPKPRPLSRLSREVSAEETCLVKHAREYAADLAGQAGTAGVLHAASEKLDQENIRTYLAPQHYQVLPPSKES